MFNFLKKFGVLPILILLITFISPNQWSSTPIDSLFFVWSLCFFTICIVFYNKKKYFHPFNKGDYRMVGIYLMWVVICAIRGGFTAENYWEWKQCIAGTLALSMPLFVYVYSTPVILQKTLQVWIKIALPLFGLFFFWKLEPEGYTYYLGPILLLGCFLPVLPKKWMIILLLPLIIMIVSDLGARSQIIKAVATIMMGMSFLLYKYIPIRSLYLTHWICYIVPIVLLVLGINGTFNPFEALSEKGDGKYTQQKGLQEEDLTADTRTGIYEEVISSAVLNQYIWLGRTPARGNDSSLFGAFSAEELQTSKYERFENEICHANVFTWAGLVGLILYSFLYLKSSYLAIYKSNNVWMKLIGVNIAFRWTYGWVEDFNRFDIMSISLWMMIAMGFSEEFRRMDDYHFKDWINGNFRPLKSKG